MTQTILIDQVTFRPQGRHQTPTLQSALEFCGSYPARNLADHLKLRISFKLAYRPCGRKLNVDLFARVTGKKPAVQQFRKARRISRSNKA